MKEATAVKAHMEERARRRHIRRSVRRTWRSVRQTWRSVCGRGPRRGVCAKDAHVEEAHMEERAVDVEER